MNYNHLLLKSKNLTMKIYLFLIFFVFGINCAGQSKYSMYINGGLSNLFEATVANESSGTHLGIGLEKQVGKFVVFASFENISCQNNSRNGLNLFRIDGGEWMISDYKGYINLQREDWAFNDVVVNEKLFSAGKWNYPGYEQTFDSKNLIFGIGYQFYRKKIFSISGKIGLATSLIHVSAINLVYSTDLDEKGKQFLVEIPSYLKYLYFSSYIELPFQFDITTKSSVGIVGSLYRANNLFIPSLGIQFKTRL